MDDKQKDEGAPLASAPETAASVAEAGADASGKETLIGNGGCRGSHVGEAAAVGGAFGNGDDIMIEVLDSDVYVDGVCRPNEEGNAKGEACRDGSVEGEPGWERNGKSLDDGKEEVQVVVEEAAVVGASGERSVKEGVDEETAAVAQNAKSGDESGDPVGLVDAKPKEAVVVDDGVKDSGVENKGLCSPVVEKSMNCQTSALKEKDAVIRDDKKLNSEYMLSTTGAPEETVRTSRENQVLEGETVCGGISEHNVSEAIAETVDTPTVASVGSEDRSKEDESSLNVEGIESSAHDKDLACPERGPLAKIEEKISEAVVGMNEVHVAGSQINVEHQPVKDETVIAASDHQDAQVNGGSEVLGINTEISTDSVVENSSCVDMFETGDDNNFAEKEALVTESKEKDSKDSEMASVQATTVSELSEDKQPYFTEKGVPDPSQVGSDAGHTKVGEQATITDAAGLHDVEDRMEVDHRPTDDTDGRSFAEKGPPETPSGGKDVKDTEMPLAQPADVLELAEGNQPNVDENEAPNSSQVDPDIGNTKEEQAADTDKAGLHDAEGMEVEDQVTEDVKQTLAEETSIKQEDLKPGSSVGVNRAVYRFPRENVDAFSVSELVWGKVKSHPWWPGQIFFPSDSSEKAMKYHRKDCFLVAYFGDRSFAWNEASSLRSFFSHFSQMVTQSSSETFQNAVNCALHEVSRRVELGLACSCIPKDVYDKIKIQIVENPGIREESSSTGSMDKSMTGRSFEPEKLLEYIKVLAQFPCDGGDQLDLVIAKAQLLAVSRQKGYNALPEFLSYGELLEDNDVALVSKDGMCESNAIELAAPNSTKEESISPGQDSCKPLTGSSHGKRERSSVASTGDALDYPEDDTDLDGKSSSMLISPSSGKKRKTFDQNVDSSTFDGRKSICLSKVDSSAPSFPKPSFKIGECIRKVASQLTGSSVLKSNSDMNGSEEGSELSVQKSEDAETGRLIIPSEYSSLGDILSQLHLAALDPMKEYSFQNILTSFFSDFRNLVAIGPDSSLGKVAGKRKKASQFVGGSSSTFEFEDMNDSYWTDRIIGNGFEEQPLDGDKKVEGQLALVEVEKPRKMARRAYTKRRESDDSGLVVEKPAGYVSENSPAELVLFFPGLGQIPSETNLNKILRRFGPLKESETELDTDTNRARVIFKRCSDAEVAFNSAQKFNIFGPVLVKYQLNYSLSYPFKAAPVATLEMEGFEGIF